MFLATSLLIKPCPIHFPGGTEYLEFNLTEGDFYRVSDGGTYAVPCNPGQAWNPIGCKNWTSKVMVLDGFRCYLTKWVWFCVLICLWLTYVTISDWFHGFTCKPKHPKNHCRKRRWVHHPDPQHSFRFGACWRLWHHGHLVRSLLRSIARLDASMGVASMLVEEKAMSCMSWYTMFMYVSRAYWQLLTCEKSTCLIRWGLPSHRTSLEWDDHPARHQTLRFW